MIHDKSICEKCRYNDISGYSKARHCNKCYNYGEKMLPATLTIIQRPVKVNVNLESLGLEGYNSLALAAIKEELDKCITIQGIEKIKETTKEILSDVKPEYTLSEIIECLKGASLKEEYEYDEGDSIALIINGEEDGYKHIYLSEEEPYGKSKYNYDYQIDINREGKPYSIKLKGKEIDKNKILGGLYGLDELLFKIYASGSKIILDQGLDVDDYDIYFRSDY